MSMSNGRPKSKQNGGPKKENGTANGGSQNGKKAASATVYPILRPVQNQKVADVDVQEQCNGDRFAQGQVVKPKPARQPQIVASVAEFVYDVIPQTSNQPQQQEPIQWVRIQKLPLDIDSKKETFIVIIGLARGYQIFLMKENGSCVEVLSDRMGPLRIAHILPPVADEHDNFIDERPLLALVDGNPMSADNKFCAATFMSLRSGNVVQTLKFDTPVLDLNSTKKCVIVVLAESIVICDPLTLKERCSVVVPAPSDSSLPPIYALNDTTLAFADCSLNQVIQSCGGRMECDDQSYSGQMMNAAKQISKTVSSIGESLVSSFSSPSSEKRNGSVIEKGVVSIIDTTKLPTSKDSRPTTDHYLAHFVAHESGLGYLSFGNGARLLLTVNALATSFNIFLVHPHPTCSSMSAVQHIYTLRRGTSAAKVIDTAFTADNRWLAIATNHGTTHVYAIAPYGGPVTTRTHAGKFVNKESNFERTAGLTSENQLSYSVHAKPQVPGVMFKDNPIQQNQLLAKTITNPRFSRFPPPITLWAITKVRQKYISAANLTAWATDNSPVPITTSNKHQQLANGQPLTFENHRKLSLVFGTSYGNKCVNPNVPVLFVMSPDGQLAQYKLEVHREPTESCGSITSLSEEKSVEAPVRMRVIALSEWSLTRNKGTVGVDFISPPLEECSDMIQTCNLAIKERGRSKNNKSNNAWMQHVEISTYCGPHRRLWQGPQFSFGVYNYTGHSSAELVSPGANQIFMAQTKCCPVLIEKNSNNMDDQQFEEATRIIYSNWNAEQTNNTDDPLASLKEQLEDAMKDEEKEVLTKKNSK